MMKYINAADAADKRCPFKDQPKTKDNPEINNCNPLNCMAWKWHYSNGEQKYEGHCLLIHKT